MLTESEKAWLEQRDAIQFALDGYRVPGLDGPYEMRPDYEDAALFEARVVAKLATYATMMVGSDIAAPCLECPCQKAGVCYHGTNKSCQWSFLTTARLAVEEEMDAEV